MFWLRRRYGIDAVSTLQVIDQFSRHSLALSDKAGLLMVEQRHSPIDCTIWIRLPDKAQAALYPGFEAAPEDQLPHKPTLVFGKNDEFEKMFGHGSDG